MNRILSVPYYSNERLCNDSPAMCQYVFPLNGDCDEPFAPVFSRPAEIVKQSSHLSSCPNFCGHFMISLKTSCPRLNNLI